MRTVRPYWAIYTTGLKEGLGNGKVILAGVIVTLFRVFLYGAFYKVAYSRGSAGMDLSNTVWSVAIFFVFNINLGLRDLFRIIGGEVATGDFELEYLNPTHWQFAKVYHVLGKNSVEFLGALVLVPLYLWWYVGVPDTSFWTLEFALGYAILSVLGVVSSCCLFMTIGLTAFRVGDISLLAMYAQRFILILGGGFVPMALLPYTIQEVVRWLPTAVYGGPTLLFSEPFKPILWSFVAAAAFWTGIMLWVNSGMWKWAQRRVGQRGVRHA